MREMRRDETGSASLNMTRSWIKSVPRSANYQTFSDPEAYAENKAR